MKIRHTQSVPVSNHINKDEQKTSWNDKNKKRIAEKIRVRKMTLFGLLPSIQSSCKKKSGYR